MHEALPARTDTLTIDGYRRLPDEGMPSELVRGRVVKEPQPGFEHGRLQIGLARKFAAHIEEAGLDLVCLGPTGFILKRDPPTVRAPDLAVIQRSRVPADPSDFVEGAPELAVEIVSPSNTAAEIEAKVRDYLTSGADTVWVVYPRARQVAVHDPTGHSQRRGEHDALTADPLFPGFHLALADLFRP